VFLVTFGLLRGQWQKAAALGVKTGCGAFALVAIVWAGIAGWAFVNDEDPWKAIPPGVPRPNWRNFIGATVVSKRSPAVACGGLGLIQVRNGKSRSAHV
jgi:hypothetical protein